MARNKLILQYPASIWGARWKDALPAGNGSIGAAVYGGTHEETIMITHEDLWWKSSTPMMPDVSDRLPEVRHLLSEHRASEADKVLANALNENGYNPQMGVPLPLGDLKIIMPSKQAFKKYSRTLNMETGEITVDWMDGDTNFQRVLFVSRTDDIVVCQIQSHGPQDIDTWIHMDMHDRSDARMSNQVFADLPQGLEVNLDHEYFHYAVTNDDGTDFGAVVRVWTEQGTVECQDGKIHVSGTKKVLLIVKPFVKGERRQEWNRLKAELSKLGNSYQALFLSHEQQHKRIFNAMSFQISDGSDQRSNEELLLDAYQGETPSAMVEKMWAYGRYLLISSSREGGHPCPLLGLWCGEYVGFWSFNMSNENLQMIYWQALSGHMPELLLAVFDYHDRLMDDFRENARKLYGCRGIFIPGPNCPDSGLLKTISPHIIHWTGGAGWIAQHYYDYYLYTGDVEFLKNRAIPFLRETALFYQDFLVIGEDGYFISMPSNSPENTPGNYWRGNTLGGYEEVVMETTINATMDFAIAKEVFTHLIEACRRTAMYVEEISLWEQLLERIPPYQINEDGAVKEWMHPDFTDNYHHRHQSHIYPVFPGTEVTRHNDPELFEAFVKAVKQRLVIGLKQQSGWSLAHMACNYARMGEGDLALECLDILSRSCVLNNFYTLHNDYRGMGIGVDMEWAPFQIDANMGWSAAIHEMLLFSLEGTLSIAPALPGRWRKGEIGPLLARGQVSVTLQWDQDAGVIHAELLSPKKDQEVKLIWPEGWELEASRDELDPSSLQLRQGVSQRIRLTRTVQDTISI